MDKHQRKAQLTTEFLLCFLVLMTVVVFALRGLSVVHKHVKRMELRERAGEKAWDIALLYTIVLAHPSTTVKVPDAKTEEVQGKTYVVVNHTRVITIGEFSQGTEVG